MEEKTVVPVRRTAAYPQWLLDRNIVNDEIYIQPGSYQEAMENIAYNHGDVGDYEQHRKNMRFINDELIRSGDYRGGQFNKEYNKPIANRVGGAAKSWAKNGMNLLTPDATDILSYLPFITAGGLAASNLATEDPSGFMRLYRLGKDIGLY